MSAHVCVSVHVVSGQGLSREAELIFVMDVPSGRCWWDVRAEVSTW